MRALRVFRDKTSLSANPALWPSIEKARHQLAYDPTIGLEDGLRRTLLWYRDNQAGERK